MIIYGCEEFDHVENKTDVENSIYFRVNVSQDLIETEQNEIFYS
jgi:hypothetical protein